MPAIVHMQVARDTPSRRLRPDSNRLFIFAISIHCYYLRCWVGLHATNQQLRNRFICGLRSDGEGASLGRGFLGEDLLTRHSVADVVVAGIVLCVFLQFGDSDLKVQKGSETLGSFGRSSVEL